MLDDPTLNAEDEAALTLVRELMRTGNLHPLVGRLRAGETGPEHARDVLRILGDLDIDLLVQVALDTLTDQYVADPGIAHQPRRERRGDDEPAG